MIGDCEKCEELLQPYLDRVLNQCEIDAAESHLSGCDYCRRRYHFEETLRTYVRVAAGAEQMPPELKAKLSALRTPL